MSHPNPQAGLVIRYSYLWKREHDAGRDEGTKDRPCAIVLSIQEQDGEQMVHVLPITHTPPARDSHAIEIPAATKRRLGLDSDRSWIVLTELNKFVWPGPDLRAVAPGQDVSTCVYGVLPPKFFACVRDLFIKRLKAGKLSLVLRTD